ncbi:MAG: AMP-binding protein [Muribaculaceae bacterium]|nr:AMP-binding protein [Muribaculaceae bacterium]
MNFLKIFCDSFIDNWERPAITDLDTGLTLDYASLGARIERVLQLFAALGIPSTPGKTHIGIIGENSIDWVTVYMSVMLGGHVAVTAPLSANIDDTLSLISIADVEVLFIDKELVANGVNWSDYPSIKLVITMDTQRVISKMAPEFNDVQRILDNIDQEFVNMYPSGFLRSDIHAPNVAPDTPLAIFFTSGTVGMPKPVVLTSDNLEGNAIFGIKSRLYPRGASTVVNSPLGSVRICIFCMLVPLASGCEIKLFKDYYNPQVLIKVFKECRPLRIILNPSQARGMYSIVQREYYGSKRYKFIRHIPFLSKLISIGIKRTFNRTVGGKCKEVVIGSCNVGRGLMSRLTEAGINFCVSYGLVETGGIVTYATSSEFVPGTVGRPMKSIVKCRLRPIDIPGLPDGAGILEVRGMNVMKEYYKDPELTAETFTPDGWLQTGDLATINERGEITLIARMDTLIQRNGGVAVPERIEACLIDTTIVSQAVAVERDGLIVAIVYPDIETIHTLYGPDTDIEALMEKKRQEINATLPPESNIEIIEISPEPLDINLKGNVSRYMYY